MLDFYEYAKDRIQGKAPKGARRSPDWRKVRGVHMAAHPDCEVCGRTKTKVRTIECHHILSYFLFPDLELEPENLVSLCRRCHLLFGHHNNWKRLNMNIRSDIAVWRMKIQGED